MTTDTSRCRECQEPLRSFGLSGNYIARPQRANRCALYGLGRISRTCYAVGRTEAEALALFEARRQTDWRDRR